MNRNRLILVFAFATLIASIPRAEERERPGCLSPPDLMAIAEKSETSYKIGTLENLEGIDPEDFAEVLWPSVEGGLEFPWIETEEDGSRSLSAFDLGEGCEDLLLEGETFFDKKQFDKAKAFYTRATARFPRCYVAYSHVGDCHYFQDNYSTALEWYEMALSLNPYDFRTHFYKGNTLLRLGRYPEAREAYIQALALQPHRESIVEVLRARSEQLEIEFVDQPFLPRALARKEEDGVGIYFDEGGAYWLVYGLCKGIWIGEAQHREERTGNSDHDWSLTEERQCILSMMESYFALLEDKSIEPDPEMERILSVLESKTLDGFVIYEIAYRLYTHTTLLLPETMFDAVVEYLRHHVVRKTPDGQTLQDEDASK